MGGGRRGQLEAIKYELNGRLNAHCPIVPVKSYKVQDFESYREKTESAQLTFWL